jgi:hypothetical protein
MPSMLSVWIRQDSLEYPPERTMAVGMPRSRAMVTTIKSRSTRSFIVSRNPARGSPAKGSDPAL